MIAPGELRPLRWVGASRKDYGDFPASVQESFGFELFLVQTGQHPPSAKPLKGLGSGVLELIESHDGNAFRTIYTVRFANAVYLLHCFTKKSKRGVATPQAEIDLVRRRLKDAENDALDQK